MLLVFFLDNILFKSNTNFFSKEYCWNFFVDEITELLQNLNIVLLFLRWICIFLDEEVEFHPYLDVSSITMDVDSFIAPAKIAFCVPSLNNKKTPWYYTAEKEDSLMHLLLYFSALAQSLNDFKSL